MTSADFERTTPSSRAAWIEIGVVVAVAVLPHLVSAIGALMTLGASTPTGSIAAWLRHAAISVQVSVVLLFVMSRSGRSWSHFGLGRPKLLRDSLLAVGLVVAATLVTWMIWIVLYPFAAPSTASEGADLIETGMSPAFAFLVLTFAMFANAWAEELAMRGFLIPRLLDVGVGRTLAVVIPAVLFASYHLYQGVVSTVIILAIALVDGVIFLAIRRLWPFVLAHFALNMMHVV